MSLPFLSGGADDTVRRVSLTPPTNITRNETNNNADDNRRELVWGFGPPPLVSTPPQYLPEPALAYNVEQKKREIFQQARETIAQQAQYTKHGRKPWTQITVRLPIITQTGNDDDDNAAATPPVNTHNNQADDRDLAVVWALMNKSTRSLPKENSSGDLTWTIEGCVDYCQWLGVDFDETLPADKYIHPVEYDTGTVERKRIEKQMAKNGPSPALEAQLAKLNAAASSKNGKTGDPDSSYSWANYEECKVIFKKKQPRKTKFGELQLVVRIRTYFLGSGDPKMHGGYMLNSRDGLHDMDPTTSVYAILKQVHGRY